MERPASSTEGRQAGSTPGPGNHPAWLLLLLALVAWQGWLTLGLFGPLESTNAWRRLLDDQPILSGQHPLHQYHGLLGARSFLDLGASCCFDPQFQAGYPKTPIFDSDSRPAELFFVCAGGASHPAAYKIGLAVCCLLVPLLLALSARAMGLSRVAACLAAFLGQLVWWAAPAQALLEAGKLDLLLAALAALVQTSLLVRFHYAPGLAVWLGLLLSGYAGWFAHPTFFFALVPMALLYYLSVGAKHRLVWHLALLLGLAGAVAVNAYWLNDWIGYWWLRVPLRLEARLLAHRTLGTIWDAPLWGPPPDRLLAVGLFLLAGAGAWLLNRSGQRATARLFGLATLGCLVLCVGGILTVDLNGTGAVRLVAPFEFFAVLPAAHAAVALFRLLARWTGGRARAVFLVAALVPGALLPGHAYLAALARRCAAPEPLAIGLNADRQALVSVLRQHTAPTARILWEDRPVFPAPAEHPCSLAALGVAAWPGRQPELWTPLLPLWTERAFVGGLDADAYIEHTSGGLADGVLAGRPLQSWTDDELEGYCRRYNVGWVVCWSQAAVERFGRWSAARELAVLHDGEAGRLFAVSRPHSFALRGRAEWLRADSRRIVLGDLVPENGVVVLSLHYQAGMKASPGHIEIERELDPHDPIPFVRLRLGGPLARLTITWEGR
jgi:hypothetical protein